MLGPLVAFALPAVSADSSSPAALPGAEAHRWFTETGRARTPSWRNEVTLRSVGMMDYEPGAYVERIGPTPLLMIVAADDHPTTDLAVAAYERAREPKRLVTIPDGHFAACSGPDGELASSAARDWFLQHLRAAGAEALARA